MALTFAQLQTKVSAYAKVGSLTTQIQDAINIAIRKIERGDPIEVAGEFIPTGGNWRGMRAYATGTLTDESAYLTHPTRYRDMEAFYIVNSGSHKLLRKTSLSDAFVNNPRLSDSFAQPLEFASDDANSRFIVRPTPDEAYTYHLFYYAYSAEMTLDADTNWWTNNAWEIPLCGALLQLQAYIKRPEEIQTWAALLRSSLQGLRRSEEREKFSGKQNIKVNWDGLYQGTFDINAG